MPQTKHTKKTTCLWTSSDFKMPPACPIKLLREAEKSKFFIDERIYDEHRNSNRQNNRSQTPKGFAKAVFLANEPLCRTLVKPT